MEGKLILRHENFHPNIVEKKIKRLSLVESLIQDNFRICVSLYFWEHEKKL